eukprot:ctg_452.g219
MPTPVPKQCSGAAALGATGPPVFHGITLRPAAPLPPLARPICAPMPSWRPLHPLDAGEILPSALWRLLACVPSRAAPLGSCPASLPPRRSSARGGQAVDSIRAEWACSATARTFTSSWGTLHSDEVAHRRRSDAIHTVRLSVSLSCKSPGHSKG